MDETEKIKKLFKIVTNQSTVLTGVLETLDNLEKRYVFSSCSILGLGLHLVSGIGCGLAVSKKQARS